MRWLRGILGTKPNDVQPSGLDPQLQALLDEHLLPAFDRQLAFGEIVGDRDWQLDQDEGVLRLGDDMVLPAQVLGTVSEASGSWRWAWANESVAENLTNRAREAAAIGSEREIGVFTDADVDLGRIIDGHVLALVVADLLGADAYYRCPYDGGEVFVLVELPPMGRDSAESVSSRAMSVVSQALLGVPVPIRQTAVTNYLRGLGLPVRETDGDVRVEDGSQARFRFDRQGRLTEIRGTRTDENLGPAGPVLAPPAPQGLPLDQWADRDMEAAEDWRDASWTSPIDVLRIYQRERHDWEVAAARAGDKRWPEMKDRLTALHGRVSTDRSLDERDTSFGRPPSRDPNKTRVIEVTRSAPKRAILRVEEDDPTGYPQEYEIVAVLENGRWRLDDRIAIFASGHGNLDGGGHEPGRWRPRNLNAGGHEIWTGSPPGAEGAVS